MPEAHPAADDQSGSGFPRVPAYAWSWLQRSRPVLVEAAQRLTGTPPGPGFVEALRVRFDTDPFTRDVVVGVVADVAFNGRVPTHRPPGASWDRGLTWWAAAIAGTTPAQFEARTAPAVTQRRLFGGEEDQQPPPARGPASGPRRRAPSAERRMLVQSLRELLRASDGDMIPAAGVRQLLATLDQGDGDEEGPAPRQ